MLIAFNKDRNRTEANEAIKKAEYVCPACDRRVLPKQGEIKIWHFAHKYLGDCWWASEGEDHLQAKVSLKNIFSTYYKTELEVFVGTNIIDVLLDKKFAIEIQCSRISPIDLMYRTQLLTKKGYAVLWLLAGQNIRDIFDNIEHVDKRTRNFIYLLHSKMYFGRFYIYDDNQIFAAYPYYRTKTLIKSIKLVPITNLKLVAQRIAGNITIARFFDKYEK